jgi:hypothetical protein
MEHRRARFRRRLALEQLQRDVLEQLQVDIRALQRHLAVTVNPTEMRRVRAEIRALEEYYANIQSRRAKTFGVLA